MKTEVAKKSTVKIASEELQDNVKNTRKTLKSLQSSALDKENIVVKATTFKEAKLMSEQEKAEAKRKKLQHKAVQTYEDYTVTADDLTSDDASEEYWRRLAEKRGEALNDSLQENERLKENIEALQEENKICKEMLDESKHLVEILQEMINEGDTSTELAEEATECPKE